MDSRLPTDRWNHRLCWIWATLVMLGTAPVWAQQTETGVPTDQPLQNNSASAIVPFEHFGYGSRLRVDHRAGESIGSDTSYTSLGLLAPFWNIWSDVGDEIVAFVDGRFVVRNDRRVAGNIGLGGRWYSARNDWLIGASVWWDIDDTHAAFSAKTSLSTNSLRLAINIAILPTDKPPSSLHLPYQLDFGIGGPAPAESRLWFGKLAL